MNNFPPVIMLPLFDNILPVMDKCQYQNIQYGRENIKPGLLDLHWFDNYETPISVYNDTLKK